MQYLFFSHYGSSVSTTNWTRWSSTSFLPCWEALRRQCVQALVTSNVADHLLLKGKGHIQAGFDADFTLLDDQMNITAVWAKGRQMVKDGKPVVFGTYEK